MDDFVLDLRDISREGGLSLPVSYFGYIPNREASSLPIIHPTADFVFSLSASPEATASYEIDGELLPPVKVPCAGFLCPGRVYRTLFKGFYRENCYFSYDASLLSHFEFFRAAKSNCLFEINSGLFVPYISEILELCKRIHAFGSVDRLDRLCETLVDELILFRKEAGRRRQCQDEKSIREIASYIEMHFRENIDFDKLLRNYGISKRTFLRHWNLLFEEPPGRYMEGLKVKEACRLLVSTDASIGRIANSLGFADPFYFSRFFQRRKGVSPSRFRAGRETYA